MFRLVVLLAPFPILPLALMEHTGQCRRTARFSEGLGSVLVAIVTHGLALAELGRLVPVPHVVKALKFMLFEIVEYRRCRSFPSAI